MSALSMAIVERNKKEKLEKIIRQRVDENKAKLERGEMIVIDGPNENDFWQLSCEEFSKDKIYANEVRNAKQAARELNRALAQNGQKSKYFWKYLEMPKNDRVVVASSK